MWLSVRTLHKWLDCSKDRLVDSAGPDITLFQLKSAIILKTNSCALLFNFFFKFVCT